MPTWSCTTAIPQFLATDLPICPGDHSLSAGTGVFQPPSRSRAQATGSRCNHAEGQLAEIIVLDQFSRNACRGTPEAFSADPLARALAQEAVGQGVHRTLDPRRLGFLYMPYMHSESAVIHDIAVRLFSAPGLSENLKAELGHKAIIDRFGRYPYRNAILGGISTPEEAAFLREPGLGAGFNGAPR